MRKPVALLTIVAIVSSVMTVLAGCGSSAPTDQPAAAPTETPSVLLEPTATASTPLVVVPREVVDRRGASLLLLV